MIGIIAAMDVELDLINKEMINPQTKIIAGTTFVSGKIGNNEVVTALCGMGMVNAACCTQAMISTFNPDYIINTGCAGGIGEGLQIGDIVLADKTAEWNLDTSVIGNPIGYVSTLDTVFVKADETLLNKIKVNITEENVHVGTVVSADQFVSSPEQRRQILSNFPDALCTEMEGAAVGHVCAQNGIPFCVVRALSDTADAESHVDFPTFAKKAGESSASMLIRFLNA